MILKVAMPGKVQFKLIRREPAFFMAHEGDIHYIGGTSGNGTGKRGDSGSGDRGICAGGAVNFN